MQAFNTQPQGSANRPLLAMANNLYYKGKGHNPEQGNFR
jgi:hypothetical protein